MLVFMAEHSVESQSHTTATFPAQRMCLAALLRSFPMQLFARAHVLERRGADISDIAVVLKIR